MIEDAFGNIWIDISRAGEPNKKYIKTRVGTLNEDRPMKYRVRTSCLENLDYNEIIREDANGNYIGETNQAKYNKGVIERNPDWFEPIEQVEEGDWIYSEYINRVFRVVKGKDMSGANRVIFPEDMGGKGYTTTFDLSKKGYRKATTDEIESELIKEAKRRELVKGSKIKVVQGSEHIMGEGRYEYDEDKDLLMWLGHAEYADIYHKGNWAEAMQAHTDATLDTLKERVSSRLRRNIESQFDPTYNSAISDVIQLIDELRNDRD